MPNKHYNCAWCGHSLGHHANEWAAIKGRDCCPYCGKPSWADYDNRMIPQVFAAPPAAHSRPDWKPIDPAALLTEVGEQRRELGREVMERQSDDCEVVYCGGCGMSHREPECQS